MNITKLSDGQNQYYIQENKQSNLKGVLWTSAGMTLVGTATALTAETAGFVALTTLYAFGMHTNSYFNSMVGGYFPWLVGFTLAAAAVDYAAIKCAGYCINNSIYHLGPKYQIVQGRAVQV